MAFKKKRANGMDHMEDTHLKNIKMWLTIHGQKINVFILKFFRHVLFTAMKHECFRNGAAHALSMYGSALVHLSASEICVNAFWSLLSELVQDFVNVKY